MYLSSFCLGGHPYSLTQTEALKELSGGLNLESVCFLTRVDMVFLKHLSILLYCLQSGVVNVNSYSWVLCS